MVTWLVAVEDIEEDEELFTIPSSSILTVENSDFYSSNQKHLQEIPPWAALALTLIYEHGKGPESAWGPYLNILPDELDTLMYWSQSELAELQASTVLDRIGRATANDLFEKQLWPIAKPVASQFGYHADSFVGIDGKADFLNLCHRMAALIFAYGFDLDLDVLSDEDWEELEPENTPNELKKGMVPLADLLNADGDLNNASQRQRHSSLKLISSTGSFGTK